MFDVVPDSETATLWGVTRCSAAANALGVVATAAAASSTGSEVTTALGRLGRRAVDVDGLVAVDASTPPGAALPRNAASTVLRLPAWAPDSSVNREKGYTRCRAASAVSDCNDGSTAALWNTCTDLPMCATASGCT